MNMSLTRLLNEIKLVDKKISKAQSGSFIGTMKGNTLPAGFSNKQELENKCKENLQSVKDLIRRRSKLKSLLTRTNATTEVQIGSDVMTIAEAIDRKNTIHLEQGLLNALKQDLRSAEDIIQRNNKTVDENVTRLLETSYGRDKKVTEEERKVMEDPYRKQHEMVLVDPSNLRKQIEELERSIDLFNSEVDFTLSEVNAKTEVDVT